MFGKILSILRMIGVLVALAFFLGQLMLLNTILGQSDERGFRYRRKFTRAALRILGVHLTVNGQPVKEVALYVGNHRSLVDPLIQLSFINAYVVSKAEVARYPIVGRGARETGVIFVKRQELSSRAAAKNAIRSALESGRSVLIYPEGTTSNEETTRAFKIGSFDVAADVGVPVVPVTVDYADARDYWFDVPILPFFLRKFAKWRTHAFLTMSEPLTSRDPHVLMETTRNRIGEEILKIRERLRKD